MRMKFTNDQTYYVMYYRRLVEIQTRPMAAPSLLSDHAATFGGGYLSLRQLLFKLISNYRPQVKFYQIFMIYKSTICINHVNLYVLCPINSFRGHANPNRYRQKENQLQTLRRNTGGTHVDVRCFTSSAAIALRTRAIAPEVMLPTNTND